MRKAALLCGTLSLAVFVSFYLLPESVLLPAACVCALLSALSLLLPRGKGRARAHLALLGAAIGLFTFFVQEHFLAAPSDALALDEPFTGLDADNRAAAQRCVARAAREKIVLLVSHEDDALTGAEVRLQ